MFFARRKFFFAFPLLAASLIPRAANGAGDTPPSPREIYDALNDLRVDPEQVYPVNDLRLRRDAVNFTFIDGTIGFLQAYGGRLTGLVFTGQGHISANLRDAAERASLAHFLGVPLLDQNFSGAYLRFDDGTAEEMLDQLRRSGAGPVKNGDLVDVWNRALPNLNPIHSSRFLLDWTSQTPMPFFYAELLDQSLGPYEVLVDSRRRDTVLIGQDRWAKGNRYYDVWTSFRGSDAAAAPPPPSFAAVSYTVETTIDSPRNLEGVTTIELRSVRGGDRGVPLELSPSLTVLNAQDGDGNALDVFQNQLLGRTAQAERGNDLFFVYLPQAPRAGQSVRLRISYRGGVISDAGNGVYFVGDRGSWYPHAVGGGQFATYEATFRWPRKLQLVATGEKIEEREEGEQRVGRWKSEGQAPVAGFNLGAYRIEKVDAANGIKVEVAANAQLEKAILERLQAREASRPGADTIAPLTRPHRDRMRIPSTFEDVSPAPVADALNQVGQEIANAIRFEQQWMGPFPYHSLVVSQIPGTIGQGFPGLVYLPTPSFFAPLTQQQAGLSENMQEMLNALIPYHEVAHQWWGNVVGWDSYRDQWITEGLANYLALVSADAAQPGSHLLARWLERYRNDLTAPPSGLQDPADDAGPLVHGFRLNSSRDPGAYEKIIYGKGTWVFHMLRMMLQAPAAKNPDERFMGLLRALLESNRYKALSTEDLQKAVERVMIPAMAVEGGRSMDWFFEQFVRSTGIPAYEVEYTARPSARGFQVRGKLIQNNVPDDFVLRVPLYAQAASGKPTLLGYVTTLGEETPFQFTAVAPPKKLLVDPQLTLLCVPPSSASPSPE